MIILSCYTCDGREDTKLNHVFWHVKLLKEIIIDAEICKETVILQTGSNNDIIIFHYY